MTDAGLKELAGLAQLQDLDLRDTQVTGSGLKDLKELTNLKTVVLANTSVADEELKGLKELNLGGTLVSEPGRKKLGGVLPQCKIQP